MKFRKIKTLILFIFSLATSIYSNDFIEYKLQNGLTIILKPYTKVPIVTVQIWVKAGSVTENEYAGSGISHLIEHLIYTSTETSTTSELAQRVRELGGDMNGWTSFENTTFYWTLPASNVYKILPIIKEMIFRKKFQDSEIKKEKDVILKEINMVQDSPDRFFSYLLFSNLYEKAFYKFPVIGQKELFLKLTENDILNYYKRMYSPNNMALIIAGDFELEKLKLELTKTFGDVPQNNSPVIFNIEEPDSTGFKEINEFRNDVIITRSALAFKTVDIRNRDLFPLDVLAIIIGKGKSSILYKKLKEEKKIVKDISAYSYTPIGKGIFTIEFETFEYSNIEKVKNEILNILKNLEKYISKEDLNRAKMQVISDYYNSIETTEGIARDLGMNWISTGNLNFSKYYVNKIKQVTLNEILEVAKKYLKEEKLTFIVLANSKYKKEETFDKLEKPELKKYKLGNGLSVILNSDRTIPAIAISIGFKGGQLYESKPGLTYFLSKLLLCGSKKYSKNEIFANIENTGGNIETFSGNNSFGIKIITLKDNIEISLKILSDIIKNPLLPSEEIEKERKIILSELNQKNENIFEIGKKIMFKAVYKNYPYEELNTGNIESIKSITRDDLLKHFKILVNPENSVLSISGDFDNNINELINKYFSDFKSDYVKKISEPEFRPVISAITNIISTNIKKEQSLLLIPYYGLSVKSSPEERIMAELLFEFINGQGSRLFNEIREKRGLAYYVGLFPFYGLTTGLFVFYAGTTFEKIEIVKNEMLNVIKNLSQNGITNDELNSAKKMLINSKLRELQANSEVSSYYLFEELYNKKILTITEYLKIIDSITLSDMNNFIKKYFNKENYFIISVNGLGIE